MIIPCSLLNCNRQTLLPAAVFSQSDKPTQTESHFSMPIVWRDSRNFCFLPQTTHTIYIYTCLILGLSVMSPPYIQRIQVVSAEVQVLLKFWYSSTHQLDPNYLYCVKGLKGKVLAFSWACLLVVWIVACSSCIASSTHPSHLAFGWARPIQPVWFYHNSNTTVPHY